MEKYPGKFTVGELIDILEKMPHEKEIYIYDLSNRLSVTPIVDVFEGVFDTTQNVIHDDDTPEMMMRGGLLDGSEDEMFGEPPPEEDPTMIKAVFLVPHPEIEGSNRCIP